MSSNQQKPNPHLVKDGLALYVGGEHVDLSAVHAFLVTSYWAEGISKEVVTRSIEGSIAFSVFDGMKQVGFARVITDRATFAYVADVFVLEDYRGRGISKWIMGTIESHGDLANLRRWVLATKDAHGLYRQFGFSALTTPDRFMEKIDRDIYRRTKETKATGLRP